ncbi:unnamed protein product [Oikopleura dioica]|uniref:Large ribosomal subunit protein uL15m n=1 Tax=Oikopleura dioica TaxID=34765 RepID=E4YDM6_OIKDI|nr:unnamed protein product [Oikopleura dioica]
MQNRMKEVIRALPRIKEHHIRENFAPPSNDAYHSYVQDNMKNLYRKNQPIFLWDGTPIHTGAKPSIGADHKFIYGHFRGQHGKKRGAHFVGQNRQYGTKWTNSMQLLPRHQFDFDERTNKIYEPITLWDIQRLVELGRLDPNKIIDITAIINARAMAPADFFWSNDIMGLRLVADGKNEFCSKLNIEFQMADRDAIAAVEKCGGKFTAAFYDRKSIELAVNPVDFFLKGKPVLKRQLPPPYLLKYYVAPETRGYLADKDLVNFDRQRLAKELGYENVNISTCDIMSMEKSPRQIWYGIEPGSLVNLAEKKVYKPFEPAEEGEEPSIAQIQLQN